MSDEAARMLIGMLAIAAAIGLYGCNVIQTALAADPVETDKTAYFSDLDDVATNCNFDKAIVQKTFNGMTLGWLCVKT